MGRNVADMRRELDRREIEVRGLAGLVAVLSRNLAARLRALMGGG